jgi:sialic acid synthase SpsE
VRIVEKTVGKITYAGVNSESSSKKFRRSLFVVEDIKKGEKLTDKNIRSIRPSNGLHTRFYDEVIGKEANQDIERGTPLNWNLFY